MALPHGVMRQRPVHVWDGLRLPLSRPASVRAVCILGTSDGASAQESGKPASLGNEAASTTTATTAPRYRPSGLTAELSLWQRCRNFAYHFAVAQPDATKPSEVVFEKRVSSFSNATPAF